MTQRFNPDDKEEYEDRVDFLADCVLDEFRDDMIHMLQEGDYDTVRDAYGFLYSQILDSAMSTAYDSDMTEYGSFETYYKILTFSDNTENATLQESTVHDMQDLRKTSKNAASEVLRKDIEDKIEYKIEHWGEYVNNSI